MASDRRRYGMTVADLRKIMDYDPETGLFTWKYRPDQNAAWNKMRAGKIAGYVDPSMGGYRRGFVNMVGVKYHILAWALGTGEWPDGHIDHINAEPVVASALSQTGEDA